MQLFMEHLVLPVVCPLLWRFFLRVSFNQGSRIKRWTSFCFKIAWFWLLWAFTSITIFVFLSKIEEQKMVVQFELENLDMKPDPEPALTDLIHAVSILNLKVVLYNCWFVATVWTTVAVLKMVAKYLQYLRGKNLQLIIMVIIVCNDKASN